MGLGWASFMMGFGKLLFPLVVGNCGHGNTVFILHVLFLYGGAVT